MGQTVDDSETDDDVEYEPDCAENELLLKLVSTNPSTRIGKSQSSGLMVTWTFRMCGRILATVDGTLQRMRCAMSPRVLKTTRDPSNQGNQTDPYQTATKVVGRNESSTMRTTREV